METEIMQSLVKRFRNDSTKENWVLLENFIEDKSPCIICNGPIFYSNSRISLSKDGTLKYSTNFPSSRSFREIDGQKFYLSVCAECLVKEFPEYNTMNKSRVFNVMSKITQFAFQVPDDDVKKFTQKTSMTLENIIKKYGEDEGNKRWKKYCDLQSESNKFEYKKEKHGWDQEDFDKFNKSRAVTLKNMIKKYGQEEGERVFDEYVKKQRVNGKTISWFIEKHGEDRGRIIFKEMLDGKLKGLNGVINSKPSQDLFDKLDSIIGNKYQTYYFNKNKEHDVIIEEINKVFYLDFYIEELNVCVEFFGDYYHANPKKYRNPDALIKFRSIHKVSEVWERDNNRIENLRKYRGIKTIVVWESDYYKNKDNEKFYKEIIKKCIKK
jgi:G:T-mismatch repair DNA endonuclease (very short patch repair protein)